MCFTTMICISHRHHMMILFRYARYFMFTKNLKHCLQSVKTIHGNGTRITQQYKISQSVTNLRFFTVENHSIVCEKKDNDDPQSETDFDNELDVSDEAKYFKQLLSPNVDDPIIKLLNSAECVMDVFNIIKENEHSLNEHHVSQAVLVLWTLQKIFYEFNALQCDSGNLNTEVEIENYMNKMNNNDEFRRLLHLVELWTPHFSSDAASCTLMYLKKMDVNLQHPVMQKLVAHCQHLFKVEDCDVPMTALSRFVSTVRYNYDLWSLYQLKEIFPLILKALERSNDVDSFYRITLCLIGCTDFITNSILSLYTKHTKKLIESNILNADEPYAIVKCAYLLNMPMWSGNNKDMIVRLIHMLKGRIKELQPYHLVHLNKIFMLVMEPADMLSEIQEYATQLLSEETKHDSNMTNFISHPMKSELLNCIVSFNSPLKRQLFEKLTSQHLKNDVPAKSLSSLFRILRHLKTGDVQLCNKFWSTGLKFIDMNSPVTQELKIFTLCYRYMYFNNNLAGTFHHFEFEKCMIQCLWNIMREGNGAVIPSKFARIAAFILGYGSPHMSGNESIMKSIMDKMPSMVAQFNTFDCLIVSRGLDLAMDLHRSKKKVTSQFLSHIVEINTLLNDRALQQVKDDTLSLSEITSVLKSYTYRGGTYGNKLFENFIERLKNIKDSDLSSQTVRDICSFLLHTRCLIPETLESIITYVTNNGEKLLGETVSKVLFVCFIFSYTPPNTFFDAALSSVMRDKEKMQGLFVLQSAMALSYFHHLPESLIHFIFAVNFLEQLDNEIAHCYAKSEECVSSEPSSTYGMWTFYKNIMQSEETTRESNKSVEQEVSLYLSEGLLSPESSVLHYWKNKHTLPQLRKAVFQYLNIPPSTVYSERLFSTAGLICDRKRNRLDPEREVYPNKVRHMLMKVNRSVCLDNPEVDIPWFHQKFIQDTIALEPPQNCPIYKDVYKTLSAVVGGEDLIKCNILSPYGHKIDFQILLNEKRSPVGVKHGMEKHVSRVAVLLLRNVFYTLNVPHLVGEIQLKWRHLEMLGYRVVGIKESVWNSMYMSEHQAKQHFIEKQLWPDLYC